jgi:hypothetical protein
MNQLSGALLYGKLLTLPANIRLSWKSLRRTNTRAYIAKICYLQTKSFITVVPGRNAYFSLAKVNHYEDELNKKSR